MLDADCQAHELDNLYVVDTSFFPSIGAVNPALTAMANAIRVGDHLLERLGARAMRKPAMAMVVALCITGGPLACSDSKGDSKSTTTTTVSFCDERDALRTSVDKLKNVNVVQDGTSALNSAVSAVGQAVDALAKSGKSEIQPQVDAVKSSLSKLESAIGDVSVERPCTGRNCGRGSRHGSRQAPHRGRGAAV